VGKENDQQVFHHYWLQLILIWAAMGDFLVFSALASSSSSSSSSPSQLVPPQIVFVTEFGCEPLDGPLGNPPWTTGWCGGPALFHIFWAAVDHIFWNHNAHLLVNGENQLLS
jgi:hypothetical protein